MSQLVITNPKIENKYRTINVAHFTVYEVLRILNFWVGIGYKVTIKRIKYANSKTK